jgi:hypothetical protein
MDTGIGYRQKRWNDGPSFLEEDYVNVHICILMYIYTQMLAIWIFAK